MAWDDCTLRFEGLECRKQKAIFQSFPTVGGDKGIVVHSRKPEASLGRGVTQGNPDEAGTLGFMLHVRKETEYLGPRLQRGLGSLLDGRLNPGRPFVGHPVVTERLGPRIGAGHSRWAWPTPSPTPGVTDGGCLSEGDPKDKHAGPRRAVRQKARDQP
jgi:hypothetical protein